MGGYQFFQVLDWNVYPVAHWVILMLSRVKPSGNWNFKTNWLVALWV